MEEKSKEISKAYIDTILHLDIPLNQRCMLLMMLVKADEKGCLHAKVKDVQMHYTLTAAQALIKHLCNSGFLEKVQITRRGNLYRVNLEKLGGASNAE